MPTWDANAFCVKNLGYRHAAQKFVSAYAARKHGNCKMQVLHLGGTKTPKFSVLFPQNSVNTQMKWRQNGIFRSVQRRQNVNFLRVVGRGYYAAPKECAWCGFMG